MNKIFIFGLAMLVIASAVTCDYTLISTASTDCVSTADVPCGKCSKYTLKSYTDTAASKIKYDISCDKCSSGTSKTSTTEYTNGSLTSGTKLKNGDELCFSQILGAVGIILSLAAQYLL